MQFSLHHIPFLLLTSGLTITTTTALPQSALNDLPVCAQNAGLAAVQATGCGLADLACICSSVPFLATLRAYIIQNCDADDQATALTFGQTLCTEAGVAISATVSGLASATTTAAKIAPATTTALEGTATSTMMSTGMMSATATASASASTDVQTSQTMTSSTTMPPPATFTGAAGMVRVAYEVVAALVGVTGVMVVL